MLSFLIVVALRLLLGEIYLVAKILCLLLLLLIILLNVLMVLNSTCILVIVDIAGIVDKQIELLFIIIGVNILDDISS